MTIEIITLGIEAGDAHVQLYDDSCQLWDKRICGEFYYYAPGTEPDRLSFRTLAESPHLDAVFRVVAEEYVANRANPIGAFLQPIAHAIEAVIAARDGSSVYFAESAGAVKIGWSKKVTARLAQLQTGSATPVRLLGTVPGGRGLERRLHERFSELRIGGEWFKATPELLAYIGGAK